MVLLIIFSPILIVVIIAIKLDSKGPVLADTPQRVGKNGKPFKMYKFRSMIENAHEILRENPKFSKFFAQYKKGSYKLKDDPRITGVGHFIRKHSLDEIPQLVNSFLYASGNLFLNNLSKKLKIFSLPLIINGEINIDKRIDMDAQYVRKRSIWYDLFIILKTPWAMISGKGAL